ncbi:MAG: hypothetical protein KC543_14565 [Myxococcales bacterium]|nr:hypothetical protein [Myxococcales bacterium]
MTPVAIVILLVVGLTLLGLELFVIPGFGVTGVLGLAALGVGTALAYTDLGPVWGMLSGLLSLAIVVAAVIIIPRTRVGRRMVFEQSSRDVRAYPTHAVSEGQRGVTVTPLRPTGVARFGAQEVDVVSDGEYIDLGVWVLVVRLEGARVVVEPEAEQTSESA